MKKQRLAVILAGSLCITAGAAHLTYATEGGPGGNPVDTTVNAPIYVEPKGPGAGPGGQTQPDGGNAANTGIVPSTNPNDYVNLNSDNSIVKTAEKYSYDQMCRDIKSLQNAYGNLIQVQVIGTSADNRSIHEITIGNPSAQKHIMIQAGIHAREYLTPLLAMQQLEQILKNYQSGEYKGRKVSDMLSQVAVHIIPMSNPDGISISQFGLSSIKSKELQDMVLRCYDSDVTLGRTTFALEEYLKRWKANARGVDLNHNFDSDWINVATATILPSYSGYRGTGVFSEPESLALGVLADKYPWAATVSYHSMGNIIYWDAVNNAQKESSQLLAQAISGVNGFALDNSMGKGGFKDWMQAKAGSAPSITLEIGRVACPIPISEYPSIWAENRAVMAETIYHVINQ